MSKESDEYSWQDVMIENFGSYWIRENYSLVNIGKIAKLASEQALRIKQLEKKLEIAVEALKFYETNCVSNERFWHGDFADHEVTGFQPSSKRAKEALKAIGEIT